MRIGVDIDGVVSDSYPYWLGELNKHYNKQIKELYRYEMHLIFDVPWEDMNQFFVANVDRLFMIPQPMPGARKVLEVLKRRHEIYLVTARRMEEEEVTREWLQKHHIPYDKLMVVGERSKAEICREQGLDLFIEDYAVNADMIAKTGIPVIIFDAPYNRLDLPQTVTRCYNWGQVYKYLEQFR